MSLRERVLRGGAYLALREVLGVAVRLGGVLALTRMLGPADFGVYAGSAAIATFLGYVAQWGTEVFLIRREHEPARPIYDECFTFLLLSTTAVVILALAAVGTLASVTDGSRFFPPLAVLVIGIPLNALWAPAQARLERALRFRSLAALELGGDVILYGAAVALVLAGAGVWGPVFGYLAWQGFLLLGSYVLAGLRPRVRLSRDGAREIFAFGLSFSSATWIERGRDIVNPLVVGPLLGAAAVGYVAMALRLGETLSFVTRATWRMSVTALGRVQSDLPRVRRALEEGMVLQVLASGAVLAGFALVAEYLVPALFGDRWRPALEVFPFVAAAYLVMAGFSIHNSLLYVLRRNRRVAAINATRLVTLTVVSLLLLPVIGIAGYGLALLGAQLSAVLLDREVRRVIDYRLKPVLPWFAGLMPAMFIPLLGLPAGLVLLAPVLVVLCMPGPRGQLLRFGWTVRRLTQRPRSLGSRVTSAPLPR